MQEEKNEVIDSTNDVEVTPKDGETAEEKLARLTETNAKLYARVKEAEPLAKEFKKLKSQPLQTPEKPKIEAVRLS